MEKRRPITEDDLYLTELLIARSYGNLKHSIARASSDAFSSVGETVGGSVRKHSGATAGAAIGAGILLFGLFKLLNRRSSKKERDTGCREHTSRGMSTDLLSLMIPVVTPYVSAYLEKYLGTMLSRGRN